MTEDSVRDGLNYYNYCKNNPVNFTDPDGHKLSDNIEDDISPNTKRREKILSAQRSAMGNPNYKKGGGGPYNRKVHPDTTWCNQATFDIVEDSGMDLDILTGDKSRDTTLANEAARNMEQLAKQNRKKSITDVELLEVYDKNAQAKANEGFTVIAAWENIKKSSGHIATVMPSQVEYNSYNGPIVANVGNINGVTSARRAFGVHLSKPNTASAMHEIKYYYNPNQFAGD